MGITRYTELWVCVRRKNTEVEIPFFKLKVNCNSSGEIPGCGLLYIVDSLINTFTINQTEQKWTVVLEQSKCPSRLYQPEHCVCFSSPHHKRNLSRRGKKKWWKSLRLDLKNIGPASVELRIWKGGLAVSPLGIALVSHKPQKWWAFPGKEKSANLRPFTSFLILLTFFFISFLYRMAALWYQ